jgi:hypothetical protein
MHYPLGVLSNEIFRFVTGRNTYGRMIERTRMKTERFVRLLEEESSVAERPRETLVGAVSKPLRTSSMSEGRGE